MQLPDKSKRVYFDYENDVGEKFEGYFTVKCRLTLRERHMLELEKTRLMGGHDNPTSGLMAIAVMLANLEIKLIDAPEWWKQNDNGRDIEDEEIVGKIYELVVDAEDEWRQELKKQAKESVNTAKIETQKDEQSTESPKSTGETTA